MPKKALITGLLLCVLWIVTGCGKPSISSEASSLSPTISSNISVPSISASTSGTDTDDFSSSESVLSSEPPSLSETISVFDEVLERYHEIGYVRYTKGIGAVPDRIDLWENWIEAYQKGEPAEVLLYLDGMSFPDGLYELICDGTDTYEIRGHIKKNNDVEVYHSDHILMNDFEFVFAPDIKEIKSNNILFHQPINKESMEYDTDKLPTLGSISAQQAIEIAKAQLTEYNRDIVEAVPYSLSVVGAQRLYGKNFYILESASETLSTFNERWHGTIAINADGGNQVLMTGGMDDSLPLIYDSNMVKIQGSKITVIPYRDQKTW